MKLLIILIAILSAPLFAEEIVKAQEDCPFLTTTFKEDQDVFGELKNYFKAFSNNPECNQASNAGMQTVSDLQSVLNVMNTDDGKCIVQNIDQTKLRDLALANIEKGVAISSSSPYSDCNASSVAKIIGQTTPQDKIAKCISDKYQSLTQECKSVVIPQSLQDKVAKGMGDLQKTLNQSLSSNGTCGEKTKDTLKMAVDTLSKVKAFSAFLPWGGMAGMGVDLIGTAVDKYFPTDAKVASTMMDAILSEDNSEQVACLYFNLQQKMYCNDQTNGVTADPQCVKTNASGDLVKLLENVHEIKKAADGVKLSNNPSTSSDPVDTTYLEANIDDLTKYAKASKEDIAERIKILPKIQQAKELEKINYFYKLLDIYQFSNPDNSLGIEAGQNALEEIMPLLYSSDPSQRINFEQLVMKSTPGLKMEAIKQSGLVHALKHLLGENTEEGRRMVQYNKYKNTMNEIAQSEMKDQLEKKIGDFKQQVSLVLKKENGLAGDLVGEGMLRNIVRHCALMQEIYDPSIEGKIPDGCAKFNCGKENRLNWFMPKEGQANITQFKKSYCENSANYKKIEDQYVKELTNSEGAKICGAKISDFFEIKN